MGADRVAGGAGEIAGLRVIEEDLLAGDRADVFVQVGIECAGADRVDPGQLGLGGEGEVAPVGAGLGRAADRGRGPDPEVAVVGGQQGGDEGRGGGAFFFAEGVEVGFADRREVALGVGVRA